MPRLCFADLKNYLFFFSPFCGLSRSAPSVRRIYFTPSASACAPILLKRLYALVRLGTPYTSIVPVVVRDVKEALSYYFDQSEQTRTYIDMFVKTDGERVQEALAYLVQVLGGAKEESVRKIEENIKSLSLEGLRPEDISTAILRDMEPRLIGLKEVEYYCPCSEEIARSSLLLLEEEELNDLLNEGPAEVVCKFCKKVYRFSKEQLML